jgi:outer membrane receptor protein involved in Fe transport
VAVPAATPPRSQDNLTLDKIVPTNAVGSMVQWSRGFTVNGRAHVLTAGTDFRWIDGDSIENTFALATGLTPLIHRVAGGTQKMAGVFGQDLFEVTSRLQVTASLRFDSWRNYNAANRETTIATGAPVPLSCTTVSDIQVCTAGDRDLADTSDTAVSPRVAALYRVTDKVNLWGSISRGFRAPTLKELYSPFRVGAVLTLSNDTLRPERLTGAELGASIAPISNLTVRGTWFDNRVNSPIANVSTSTNGNTRQLRNLGSTNIAGFQTDASYRINPSLSVSGAYVLDIAKVHSFTPDVSGVDLTGKYLAEVPKNRGVVQLAYSDPRRVNVAIAVQFVGMQFDDDQNIQKILPGVPDKAKVGLPAYSVTDLTLSKTINEQVDVFFGAQNLFDTLYYVGTNPTTTGTPRLVNVGIRLKIGR